MDSPRSEQTADVRVGAMDAAVAKFNFLEAVWCFVLEVRFEMTRGGVARARQLSSSHLQSARSLERDLVDEIFRNY